ncbi:manganese-dependent inorganic pyrophosphatase [Bacillus badius]|uniref:Probable manganese-dependent inorganic pyrophosphatase n=1 Tax=Bacillus badius TaxID=1455 RepID=A0ABR5AVA3_BACBA|nr:manganese-dependent inorganic pyrophosphatase [Bacillus badius]KIL78138.1 Manganese-dependent inorganic pyrophosphatase [Bacillus badius]KZN98513.1 manganese-dependent inorganic pyrophosphatase [Bacillus badius]KZR57064.1 manganese-dependent inorganic pyrophosphatase [Bacillus badius]MED4717062.1 manganese-dependent inorganic pyrophosphatase [Bacillus badius]OCS83210.1 manganese-dependent inorganic pyrophosphatase [Bacillus badius]
MSKVLIFGHKNPDTDSICSAIAYAALKKELGMDVEAVRLGELNGETEYALKQFNAEPPRLIDKAAPEAAQVILVDHNERQQSVDDINDVRVLEVIDHHRIANFETSDPLYYRAEPVGCTATILNKMYKEHGVSVQKEIAGLMLSAIISDSLLFKSPTCTEEDVKAAQELASIAGVHAEEYGLDMLKAGADLRSKSTEELVSLDSKVFSMGDYQVEVAQVNAIDVKDVLVRKEEIEKALESTIADKNLDLFLFVITDILNSDSVAIVAGTEAAAVEKAFNAPISDDRTIVLDGVVSRKKQIIPVLTDTFQGMTK